MPLRMYHFCPESYGSEAWVIAESEDEARHWILSTKVPQPPEPERKENGYEFKSFELGQDWINARSQNERVDEVLNHPIWVYGVGVVGWSEKS